MAPSHSSRLGKARPTQLSGWARRSPSPGLEVPPAYTDAALPGPASLAKSRAPGTRSPPEPGPQGACALSATHCPKPVAYTGSPGVCYRCMRVCVLGEGVRGDARQISPSSLPRRGTTQKQQKRRSRPWRNPPHREHLRLPCRERSLRFSERRARCCPPRPASREHRREGARRQGSSQSLWNEAGTKEQAGKGGMRRCLGTGRRRVSSASSTANVPFGLIQCGDRTRRGLLLQDDAGRRRQVQGPDLGPELVLRVTGRRGDGSEVPAAGRAGGRALAALGALAGRDRPSLSSPGMSSQTPANRMERRSSPCTFSEPSSRKNWRLPSCPPGGDRRG